MKTKKVLFLALLAVILVVGLVATSTALASPPAGDQGTPVRGTIELLKEVDGALEFDDVSWSEPVYFEFAFHGDLEGTVYQDSVVRGAIPWYGHYTADGTARFEGTLYGEPISFTYKVHAWGFDPSSDDWAPRGPSFWDQRAVITITGPDNRGTLQAFTKLSARSFFANYWGVIK